MHDLYLMWLSCKGVWGECSLVLTAKRSNTHDATELYEYLPEKELREKLGDDLATDLIERHTQAESKLKGDQKGQFIKTYLDCLHPMLHWIWNIAHTGI